MVFVGSSCFFLSFSYLKLLQNGSVVCVCRCINVTSCGQFGPACIGSLIAVRGVRGYVICKHGQSIHKTYWNVLNWTPNNRRGLTCCRVPLIHQLLIVQVVRCDVQTLASFTHILLELCNTCLTPQGYIFTVAIQLFVNWKTYFQTSIIQSEFILLDFGIMLLLQIFSGRLQREQFLFNTHNIFESKNIFFLYVFISVYRIENAISGNLFMHAFRFVLLAFFCRCCLPESHAHKEVALRSGFTGSKAREICQICVNILISIR